MRFADELGKYGCPNCCGEGQARMLTVVKKTAPSLAEAEAEYHGLNAARQELMQAIAILQATLDEHIRATFAGELAAIEQAQEQLKELVERKQAAWERWQRLARVAKQLQMVPGLEVRYGPHAIPARVVKSTDKRIRIDLGEGQLKWVELETLTLKKTETRN
jgi:seryl-tRNA synthetase